MKKTTLLRRIRQQLNNKYRLVVMNDKTLHEVFSYRLNTLAIYTLISSLLMLLFVLFWLLTAFTPLKRFMPGYDDVYKNPEFIALYQRISELEEHFNAQQLYTENLRKVLSGEVDSVDMLPEKEKAQWDSLNIKKANSLTAGDKAQNGSKSEITPEEAPAFRQLKQEGSLGQGKTTLQKMHLIAPVDGYVSAPFNPIGKHYGVDLVAPRNTPVKAITDGYVFSSDWTLETGNTIGIIHDNNTISFYKHNAANLKKAGTYVRAGEAIAIVGNTGMLSDGPHLHFELWVDGTPVNPADYFVFR